MPSFEGFKQGTKLLPVPSPMLGSLLAEIDDLAELKCILRMLWHAAQVAGAPKWVDESALLADAVLARALGSPDAIHAGLSAAVARGVLVEAGGRYLVHTPENARAAAQSAPGPQHGDVPTEPRVEDTPNIFSLYEANIGLLTPMVADQLRDAEQTYPVEWIEAAIREATESNARSWRYISAVLDRWAAKGRGDAQNQTQRSGNKRGEPERHPETLTAAEYVERFGVPVPRARD
jgi:DnaD/phage-associated family protein